MESKGREAVIPFETLVETNNNKWNYWVVWDHLYWINVIIINAVKHSVQNKYHGAMGLLQQGPRES